MSIRTRYVDHVIADVEAASRRHVATTDPVASQRRVAVVLVTSALVLTFIRFAQGGPTPAWLTDASTSDFARLGRWGLVNVVGYVAIPWLAVRFVLRERFAEFGLRPPDRGGWRPYAWLLAVSVPFVVLASFQPAFQAKYPFYSLGPDEGLWPWFALWWLVYAAQFLGVELFFRGFMVHGLAPRLGIGSVFVMVVPYVMIHFTKPLLEALAALVGGVVLGFLSLKTRSIWWGVAVHVAIALLMDALALGHAARP